MVASSSVKSDPSPALAAIPIAKEHEAPDEASTDPRPTPFAHAVFPSSYEEDGPTSRELMLDDRVERLLSENLELMKERAAMRSIHKQRIERCNELLDSAREGHQLAAAYVAACQKVYETGDITEMAGEVDSKYEALKGWAAKPL